jgi:hypothetical protein
MKLCSVYTNACVLATFVTNNQHKDSKYIRDIITLR